MGDPAGVGPQIIAKAIGHRQIDRLGKILIIGDRWVFEKIKNEKLKTKNYQFVDLKNVSHKNFRFGRMKKEYGRAAIEYLKRAVELVKNEAIDCLVTAPICKEAINLAGYKFNGHTEFLAQAFNKKEQDLVMMLLNRYLKISLVTRHLALNRISPALNQGGIYKTILITHKALAAYFGITQPRICVCALNPHAGEGGLLGKEEINLITPVVRGMRRLRKNVVGPLPVDTAVSLARHSQFDALIAMYHDQALIPLKLLDFDSGVNLTLGLDFVRTSPLHGTGFDIAGKNIANPASLIAAIKTAVECTRNLRKHKIL
jgi:4-hydroxythreonine-4-phosphate dehydrogenase